jgi:hypothetical protein
MHGRWSNFIGHVEYWIASPWHNQVETGEDISRQVRDGHNFGKGFLAVREEIEEIEELAALEAVGCHVVLQPEIFWDFFFLKLKENKEVRARFTGGTAPTDWWRVLQTFQ